MNKLLISNSFCSLQGKEDSLVEYSIKQLLTYTDENIVNEKKQLFNRLNYFKSCGNTKAYNSTKYQIKELSKLEIVCWYNNRTFPTGHLNLVTDLLKALKFDYVVVDNRKRPQSDCILRWNNKPFTPRYYQKEMIDLGLKSDRGVFESAVGTGKSLVLAYLLKELSVNSLIVVPSRGLLDQLHSDLCMWFGKKNVVVVSTAKVREDKTNHVPIRITTVQTLASLQKSGEIDLLVSDINAIFIDEIHHAGSKSYTALLDSLSHVYYRFGFSGTFMRNDGKQLDMWGFLSNRLYNYPAFKATEEGYLTPTNLFCYNLKGRSHKNYQKEYDLNYCASRDILIQIADIIQSIPLSQQILILVDKKDKAGQIIFDYLSEQFDNICYINGDRKKEVITQSICDFNEKETRILIGSKVIGEGIDIRSTDHLIMANGGKSEIAIVQAVGRVVRLFPGKEIANVHDFHFTNTNYLTKHFNKRLDIYNRNFEPKKVMYIDAPET